MRHGALFNGIGGFQLAAHWMGWENVFHCEIDKFCNQVVKKHFPESICYEDIKKTDFTPWCGAIDILTGGFPCQPFSTAGKRQGTEDNRYLWPEMLRAIREIKPRWIVVENVRGLVSWSSGLVFEQVQADLEAEGYEVWPVLLPACGINAPHERTRCWFIAHSIGNGRSRNNELSKVNSRGIQKRMDKGYGIKSLFGKRASSNTDFQGLEKLRSESVNNGTQCPTLIGAGDRWSNWSTQSPICGRNDGVSNRVDRIKALGNAIVPQVVLEIFKAIEAYENMQL